MEKRRSQKRGADIRLALACCKEIMTAQPKNPPLHVNSPRSGSLGTTRKLCHVGASAFLLVSEGIDVVVTIYTGAVLG